MKIRLGRSKYFAEVDDADADRVLQHNWSVDFHGTNIYARTVIDGKKVYLHRFVMEENDPLTKIDHKFGEGLDCTRKNLRRSTQKQNSCNRIKSPKSKTTTRYKGVVKIKERKYRVVISIDGKQKHIGYFETASAAARAYDAEAIALFGEFAKVNFLVSIRRAKYAS